MMETTEEQTEFLNRLWESVMNDYSDYKRYKCQKGHSYKKIGVNPNTKMEIWVCRKCNNKL